MKVSQLLHAMDRDDEIVIDDGNKKLDRMTIYSGAVRGIKRDDPINKMVVKGVFATDDKIVVLAERSGQ